MKVGYLRKVVIGKAATPKSQILGGGDLDDLAASFLVARSLASSSSASRKWNWPTLSTTKSTTLSITPAIWLGITILSMSIGSQPIIMKAKATNIMACSIRHKIITTHTNIVII
jgi:hypothetical protein